MRIRLSWNFRRRKGTSIIRWMGSDPRDSDTRIAYKGAISVTDRSGDANVLSAIGSGTV